MVTFKYLQSSLILAALQICICGGAQAGETQSSSQASVNPNTSASSGAATEASRSSSTESTATSRSAASSEAQSAASAHNRFRVIAGQPGLQQLVNEVSKEPSSRQSVTPTKKRAAHWKTRYWNQKPKHKTK
jgi:hypothetical protein